MAYLHEKKIIHGDFATRNLLINTHDNLKIADFGKSEDAYEHTYKTNMSRRVISGDNRVSKTLYPERKLMSSLKNKASTGFASITSVGSLRKTKATKAINLKEMNPWRWLPPELYSSGRLDNFSDIWAFGVTMWEMFAKARLPYKGVKNFQVWVQFENFRLPMIDQCPLCIYLLMIRCWHIKSNRRPHISQINEAITNFITKKTIFDIDENCIIDGKISSKDTIVEFQEEVVMESLVESFIDKYDKFEYTLPFKGATHLELDPTVNKFNAIKIYETDKTVGVVRTLSDDPNKNSSTKSHVNTLGSFRKMINTASNSTPVSQGPNENSISEEKSPTSINFQSILNNSPSSASKSESEKSLYIPVGHDGLVPPKVKPRATVTCVRKQNSYNNIRKIDF